MNLSQYTIKAQEVIQAAQQLAYNNKNAAIETLHLLKTILADKDSSTDFLLKKNIPRVSKGILSSTDKGIKSSIFQFTIKRKKH